MIRSRTAPVKTPTSAPSHVYTPDQLTQIRLCYLDVQHFADNFCYDYGLASHKVKLYPFQVEQQKIWSVTNTLSVQPRGTGATLMILIRALWQANFTSSKTIVIGVHSNSECHELMLRLSGMYDALPQWLKADVRYRSPNQLSLKNGSTIFISDATSANFGRGLAISRLYFDSFGSFTDAQQLDLLTQVAIFAGTTTVSGVPTRFNTPFHTAWNNVPQTGRFSWVSHHVRPDDCPQLTPTILQQRRFFLGDVLFRRQYLGDFTV